DRVDCGKPENGEIHCHIENNGNHFILNISDDGRGINVETLRKKAIEKGIYTELEANNLSNELMLETIFLDAFSTKKEVDIISGRGVGLPAVRSEVERLGGKIQVDTEIGKFTRFKFVLPVPVTLAQ
ncbi:MAG: chemotaxis protein CheA, partial [Vallitaleaceae bacterium]|nr:chemotaxis protein CheA [Vallitaleaceae bacterium]